jgi:integrase
MSIYPERHRRTGAYTGFWIVEVTVAGTKTRARATTFEAAQDVQASLKGSHTLEKPNIITMADLDRLTEGKLWRGHKDELQSSRRWKASIPLIGRETPVTEVRRAKLEAFVDTLREQGLGPKTINRYLSAVSRALRWAHEADLILSRPAIPWQKEPAGRKVWLPEDSTEDFLRHIGDHYGTSYMFCAEVLLLTGMRVSELLRLDVTEVVGDVVHLSDTKTDLPRSIPLPEGYGGRLREWIEPKLVGYRKLLKAIREASEAVCGLSLTPHGLRHTTATRLNAAGVPTLTVAKLMGHRSLETTRGYAHHEVETLRAAMGVLHVSTVGAKQCSRDITPVQALEAGGLGGNRTPVQGFAGLRSRSGK